MTAADRKLTTILAVDVVGYSAAAERDQVSATRRIAALRERINERAGEHGGRVFNTAGDGFMLEFPLASAAVRAAIALVNEANSADTALPRIRAGAHLGEVIVEGDNLMGHGVNVAARLVTHADPNTLVISDAVKSQLHGEVEARFAPLGSIQLAKMRETIVAYAYSPEGESGGWRERFRLVVRRHGRVLAGAAALFAIAIVSAGVLLVRPTRYEVGALQLIAHSEQPEMYPTLSPDGQFIVYMIEHGATTFTDTELYMRSVSGGEQTQLTDTAEYNEGIPSFSPTGDRLAYARWSAGDDTRHVDGAGENDRCQVMVRVFPNGLDRQVADCNTEGPNRISWTPDGRSLVYVSGSQRADRSLRIVMLDLENGQVRDLVPTVTRGMGDTAPTLSPDGRRVAFVRYLTAENGDVYVYDLQRQQLTQITEGQTWAQVAWADKDHLFVVSAPSGPSELWLLRADGHGRGERLAPALARLARPVVARNLIALQVETNWSNLRRYHGSGSEAVTNGNQNDFGADFSSDGTLAFMSSTSEDWLIVQPRGQPQRRLANLTGMNVMGLRWSPDGTRIAFAGQRDGRSGLFIVDAASGLLRQVELRSEETVANANWAPDGRSLIFASTGPSGPHIARISIEGGAAEALSGPGWHEAVETTDGIFAIGQNTQGLWRLEPGRAPQSVLPEVSPTYESFVLTAAREWTITNRRVYFFERLGEGRSRVLSRALEGGPIERVAEVDGTGGENLTVDPVSGDVVYSVITSEQYDVAVLPFRRR